MGYLLLVLIAAASCYAQVSAKVSLSNGIQLTIATHSESGPVTLKTGLMPASGDSFYRIFRDENNLAVFAYELEVARTEDGLNFRITAKAATDDFAARFPNADGGKPTPTLSAPLESPLLNSGEQFTIPVPTNPGLGEDRTDTVRILMSKPGVANDDAAGLAQIRFAGLRVYVHQKLASSSGASSDVAGRYAMFYLPDRGGYFFSTEAVDQSDAVERHFEQVGVVDGKHLKITLDNETYECTASAPILVHADRGQLWVYHDPNYKPAGNWTKTDPTNTKDEFFSAASDSLDWWLN